MMETSSLNPPLLSVLNATVQIEGTVALDAVSLEIPQGQSVAVLGPNGAGKTTLLRLLLREVYPLHREATSVEILGRSRWDVFELRRQIGFVSPELVARHRRTTTGLDVALSGFYASVGVPDQLTPTEAERNRALATLERLRIEHLAARAFQSLSTGEQRRLLLARALVHEPQTLVLDEPCASVDVTGAFLLMEDLTHLAAQGTALILVTHHVDEIPPAIERVVLLRDGRIFRDGAKGEILTSENLSSLYGVGVEVVCSRGYYRAIPAAQGG